jgi:hypothetical protein
MKKALAFGGRRESDSGGSIRRQHTAESSRYGDGRRWCAGYIYINVPAQHFASIFMTIRETQKREKKKVLRGERRRCRDRRRQPNG